MKFSVRPRRLARRKLTWLSSRPPQFSKEGRKGAWQTRTRTSVASQSSPRSPVHHSSEFPIIWGKGQQVMASHRSATACGQTALFNRTRTCWSAAGGSLHGALSVRPFRSEGRAACCGPGPMTVSWGQRVMGTSADPAMVSTRGSMFVTKLMTCGSTVLTKWKGEQLNLYLFLFSTSHGALFNRSFY